MNSNTLVEDLVFSWIRKIRSEIQYQAAFDKKIWDIYSVFPSFPEEWTLGVALDCAEKVGLDVNVSLNWRDLAPSVEIG